MYRIDYNEGDGECLITATLEGFWTVETLAAYSAELLSIIRKLRTRYARVRLLALSSGMTVQSAEVSQGFGQLSRELTKALPGPAAIVAGSTLNKMQASRVFTHGKVGVFTDEAEARAWLMSVGSGLPGKLDAR